MRLVGGVVGNGTLIFVNCRAHLLVLCPGEHAWLVSLSPHLYVCSHSVWYSWVHLFTYLVLYWVLYLVMGNWLNI